MKVKILFIYFVSIFIFCANVYSAQIDLSSGQTVTPDDGTWDEQEESWTCSVVDLVLGPNVLEFIATDSEGQTGSDSVTVTRTQPGYSTRGSGYTIKGCSLK